MKAPWKSVKESPPERMTEVLVLIDSHRGPSWTNSIPLVAFLSNDGNFYEQTGNDGPLEFVVGWTEIPSWQ